MSMDRRSFVRGAGAAVAAGALAGTALAEEAAPSWSNVSIDASQFEAEEREIPSWVAKPPPSRPRTASRPSRPTSWWSAALWPAASAPTRP